MERTTNLDLCLHCGKLFSFIVHGNFSIVVLFTVPSVLGLSFVAFQGNKQAEFADTQHTRFEGCPSQCFTF